MVLNKILLSCSILSLFVSHSHAGPTDDNNSITHTKISVKQASTKKELARKEVDELNKRKKGMTFDGNGSAGICLGGVLSHDENIALESWLQVNGFRIHSLSPLDNENKTEYELFLSFLIPQISKSSPNLKSLTAVTRHGGTISHDIFALAHLRTMKGTTFSELTMSFPGNICSGNAKNIATYVQQFDFLKAVTLCMPNGIVPDENAAETIESGVVTEGEQALRTLMKKVEESNALKERAKEAKDKFDAHMLDYRMDEKKAKLAKKIKSAKEEKHYGSYIKLLEADMKVLENYEALAKKKVEAKEKALTGKVMNLENLTIKIGAEHVIPFPEPSHPIWSRK